MIVDYGYSFQSTLFAQFLFINLYQWLTAVMVIALLIIILFTHVHCHSTMLVTDHDLFWLRDMFIAMVSPLQRQLINHDDSRCAGGREVPPPWLNHQLELTMGQPFSCLVIKRQPLLAS